MKKLLCLIASMSVCGCSTLRFEDYEQRILIRSKPPGAAIYYKEKKIGSTPQYVEIPRGRKDQTVTLVWDEHSKHDIRLKSRYDWSGSFVPNLVWVVGAPVGWTVDYLTGYGYRYERPPKILKPGAEDKVQTIVIAPPLAPDEDVSDDIARKLQQKLKGNFPDARIVDYYTSLPQFIEHGADYNLKLNAEDRQDTALDMRADFDATHIYFPNAQVEQDRVNVSGELREADTGYAVSNLGFDFESQEIPALKRRSWRDKWGTFVHLIPNSTGLEFGNSQPELEVGGKIIKGVNRQVPGFWGDMGSLVSSVSIGHLERPTYRRDWRFSFRLVPDFNVRYGRSAFPDRFPGVEFDRMGVSMGIGPQLGFNSRYGFAYASLALGPDYTRIKWRGATTGEKEAYSIDAILEVAYNFFITPHWYARIFTRNVNDNHELWAEAIQRATGQFMYIESANYTQTGISVGYYFPESNAAGLSKQRK